MTTPIERVKTDKAPAPIGPYEQAVRAGELIFASGQVAIDPATGKMIEGDVAAQSRRILENLKAVLEAGGSSLGRVVKVTVYLTDMADFPRVNEVYAEYLGAAKPARATVAVKALPAGAAVEMDAVAVRGA